MALENCRARRPTAGYSPGFYRDLHNLCSVDYICETGGSKRVTYLKASRSSDEADVFLVERLISSRKYKVSLLL